MRVIDQLNLNHLRVFECVYRAGNMTEAAKQLGLTQSGVSQHIKALEDTLKLSLFDRVRQRLVPTAAASSLYHRCHQGFSLLEETLLEITGQEQELTGTVRIGTPAEFGEALLLPRMARFLAQHPHVNAKVEVGWAADLNEAVVGGDLAFAFVDSFVNDKRVECTCVYDEIIELCLSQARLKYYPEPTHRQSFYEALDYVAYFDGEPLLRMWFEHHLGTKKLDLKVRAYANTCRSVGSLVVAGLGAGVLPSQQVDLLVAGGASLYRFEGSSQSPLVNPINVVYLGSRTRSLPEKILLHWLIDDLRKSRLAA